LDSVEW